MIIGRQADSVFLEVFDLVNDAFANNKTTGRAAAYLAENNPQYDDYRLVTIADTTFIVNTLVNTSLTNTNSVIDNSKNASLVEETYRHAIGLLTVSLQLLKTSLSGNKL